jgi:ADP-dependent NAD(P)H-hydrate dehydratase / NAD(P)H-hydrate epimerase
MEANHPALWKNLLPVKKPGGHKYDSGHALIYGAPELTGATRLAAESCARMGAGLVTVLADKKIANVYRAALPAHIMVRDDFTWTDARVTARLYGPGGLSIKPDYKSNLPTVLDADALMHLPAKLCLNYVLTPHEGEFARAFPGIEGSRSEKAQRAAQESGAVIVLKGHETIIAAPDGRSVVNTHASPYLASAGTGDVLAGMITGLLAQSMVPFEAACAAVWMHGEAGRQFGVGLVASDLPGLLPVIRQSLT